MGNVIIMADDQVDSVAEDTSTAEGEEVQEDQSEAEGNIPESDDEAPEEADEDGEESEEGDEQPDEGSDPDLVTVELDGKEYKVPSRLKDAVMATKDYTQKTQALAEQRNAQVARETDFTQYMEASTAHADHMANLAAIDRQLGSFQAYDWNAAFDADITSATKLQHQYNALQQERDQVVGLVQQSEQQRQTAANDTMMRTAMRTDAQMAKELPNWGDKRKAELGTFAVEKLGFTPQQISRAVTPQEIKTLHYAELGFRMSQQVADATKAEKKPKATVLSPSKNIAPKRQTAPRTLSTVTSPDEYRKLRMAQMQRKT